MQNSWLKLVHTVFRPCRPHLERCLRERDRYVEEHRQVVERRAGAVADCVSRIEAARAEVFAANDGIVTSRMTDLEREWRRLSRSDPDDDLMALWARVAPRAWLDRKRWRDSERARWLDVVCALAADVEGVDASEVAIAALREVLSPWGNPIGARVRWRTFDGDFDGTSELLADALRVAQHALYARGRASEVLERAHRLERAVREAALRRFRDRQVLANALANAAFVDCVWRGASLSALANPVTPLADLWSAGYVLSALDESGVTIAIPPL